MLKIFGGKGKKRKKRSDYDDYDEYEDDEYEYDEYDEDDYDEYEDEYEEDGYDEDDYDEYEDEYEDDEDDEEDYEEEYPAKRKARRVKAKRTHTVAAKKKKSGAPVESSRQEDELKETIQALKLEIRKNDQEVTQLKNQLDIAQLTNKSLENELSMVQALPKDYEAKLVELEQIKGNYNKLLFDKNQQDNELELHRKKSERLAHKVRQYEEELLTKQEEIDKLMEIHTGAISGKSTPDIMVYEELEHVRQELADTKRKLEQKEFDDDYLLTKEDIGEVLLGAKKQAKEIVSSANRKAQMIKNETQKKTEVLRRLERAEQEYQNYYKRIKDVKEESEQAFNQIISLVRDDTYENEDTF